MPPDAITPDLNPLLLKPRLGEATPGDMLTRDGPALERAVDDAIEGASGALLLGR